MQWLTGRSERSSSSAARGRGDTNWQQRAKVAADSFVKLPCRICHSSEDSTTDPLVAPCLCDGSMRYVHNACQQDWLKARRTPLDYVCELCRGTLHCRLTWTLKLRVSALALSSAVLWFAQSMSASIVLRLAMRLLLSWRHRSLEGGQSGGSSLPWRFVLLQKAAKLLPEPADWTDSVDALAQSALIWLVVIGATTFTAHNVLSLLDRPLGFVGEDSMTRFCIAKIGGCVLVALHVVFPSTQRVEPFAALRVVGATLLLDTFLLALLRVPLGERNQGRLVQRVAHGACRITGDFLPFAAVFFLWFASILMIAAASLVPCIALLFNEAIRDIRRQRHRHGSVQLVILITRGLLRLALFGSGARSSPKSTRVWAWCDHSLVSFWLGVEAIVLLDLVILRRGANCVLEATSQAMWSLAMLGQTFYVVYDFLQHSTETGLDAKNGAGARSGVVELVSGALDGRGGRFRSAEQGPPTLRNSDSLLQYLGTAASCMRLEDAALALSLLCYVIIHVPIFGSWLQRGREELFRLFTQIDPKQVVFYDRPTPRNRHRRE